MDSELLNDNLSLGGVSEGTAFLPNKKTYTEMFEELCPVYMAMGMSYQDYWENDCDMTIAYRKKTEIERDQYNWRAWLSGRYFYDALLMASPILRAFSKKGAKPIKFHEEPYPLTEEQKEKREERERKAKYEEMISRLSASTQQKGG